MIAFDMDNVLCHQTTRYRWDDFCYRYLPFYEFLRHIILKPIVRPIDPIVVITSRPESCRFVTNLWFSLYGYKVTHLVMMPNSCIRTPYTIFNFKFSALSEFGLSTYVEDNTELADNLTLHGINVKLFDKNSHRLVGKKCYSRDFL